MVQINGRLNESWCAHFHRTAAQILVGPMWRAATVEMDLGVLSWSGPTDDERAGSLRASCLPDPRLVAPDPEAFGLRLRPRRHVQSRGGPGGDEDERARLRSCTYRPRPRPKALPPQLSIEQSLSSTGRLMVSALAYSYFLLWFVHMLRESLLDILGLSRRGLIVAAGIGRSSARNLASVCLMICSWYCWWTWYYSGSGKNGLKIICLLTCHSVFLLPDLLTLHVRVLPSVIGHCGVCHHLHNKFLEEKNWQVNLVSRGHMY
jgi:hypothetical protein